MRQYKLLILILSIIIISCNQEKAGFTPYNPQYYEVKGPAKSIIEREYSNKSKLLYTKQFIFNKLGKLLSVKHIVDNDSISRYMQYKNNGYIENIQWNEIIKYIPEFNEYGDLIKETYVTNEINGFESSFTHEFEYDANGNVVYEKNCSIESDCSFIEYLYENNKLKQIKESNFGEVIQYDCDTLGLIISKKVKNELSGKITSQSTYKYKLDDKRNWIEKIEHENKRFKSKTIREIKYYAEAKLASPYTQEISNEPIKSFTNITLVDNYINNVLSRSRQQNNSPNTVLFIILIICSIALTITSLYKLSNTVFKNFTGCVQSNGMKRLWMYNAEPYTKVGLLLLIALISFASSIIGILLFGCIIWLLFIIIQFILKIIVFIGVVCLIFGVIGLIAERSEGCLPLIIGFVITCASNLIEKIGSILVTWGFDFMRSVNMFNWGLNIYINYWDVMLIAFIIPMIAFLAFAIIVIVLNLLLNIFEFIVTKIYSIKSPCPSCGSKATPDYIIGGKTHPVKLHPGIYGVFTHKSPVTKKEIPTMLLNGRGKITRKCKKCNSITNSETGTEKHISIVGHPSFGKSYLLYSGLSCLMDSYPERFYQTDRHDHISIENNIRRINNGEGIQTTKENRYRAIQLMLKNKLRPQYHLFFYDVAGEQFNQSDSNSAMDFYCNVQSIVFIIDPCNIDISYFQVSKKFKEWYNKQNNNSTKYRIDDSFSVLKDILEQVGGESKKIDFNFVCTKTDMGYFPALNYPPIPTEEEIKCYIIEEMGLTNLINAAEASFDNIHYFAVSAIDKNKSNLKNLFIELLKQQKIEL